MDHTISCMRHDFTRVARFFNSYSSFLFIDSPNELSIRQIFDRQVFPRSLSPKSGREDFTYDGAICCEASLSRLWNGTYNGTMAGREKGLISSRHILIYAVNLIRQRGSLCNASFHSSKLPRKAGSRRIDTRSWRVYVYEKRACLGQVAQLEFAASWFFRIACKWITRESLKQMPWRYELTTSQLSSIARFSFQREPLQVKEST